MVALLILPSMPADHAPRQISSGSLTAPGGVNVFKSLSLTVGVSAAARNDSKIALSISLRELAAASTQASAMVLIETSQLR